MSCEIEEPSGEDIFISDCGPLGCKNQAVYCGKVIAMSNDRVQIERMVKAWMNESQFWPCVWYIDDHGGHTLITNLGE